MDFIVRFNLPSELVVDPCDGTCSVEISCLLLPKNRNVIGGNMDENCLEYDWKKLKQVFARQILNVESDIEVTEEDLIAAR